MALGNVHLKLGNINWRFSLEYFQMALNENINAIEAIVCLGHYYYKQRNYSESYVHYKKAIDFINDDCNKNCTSFKSTDLSTIYSNFGIVCLHLMKEEEQQHYDISQFPLLKIFEMACELSDTNIDALLGVAFTALSGKDYERIIDACHKVRYIHLLLYVYRF